VDINSAVGRKAGLSDEKLRAVLGNDLAPFNDTERLVIELADALTTTPSNVSDELYARLRNQFSEEQLMQLGGQIAFENYRARWNRLFNVESDNLYQGMTASQPSTAQDG
jgi:alkylhydroperoxidase family enzyme